MGTDLCEFIRKIRKRNKVEELKQEGEGEKAKTIVRSEDPVEKPSIN